MAWVAVSVLLMIGGALLVLMTVLVSLILVGLHQLALAIRRAAVAGLVPTTFEIPTFRVRVRH